MIKTEINDRDYYICGDFNANSQDERFTKFNDVFQELGYIFCPASFNNPEKIDFTGVDIKGDPSKGFERYRDKNLGVYVNVIDHILSNKKGTRKIIDSQTYPIMIDIVAIVENMSQELKKTLLSFKKKKTYKTFLMLWKKN